MGSRAAAIKIETISRNPSAGSRAFDLHLIPLNTSRFCPKADAIDRGRRQGHDKKHNHSHRPAFECLFLSGLTLDNWEAKSLPRTRLTFHHE